MSASKTYATNRELGLNANGVVEQYRNKGSIPASANGSPHHIVNDGGSIRPHRDQVGWRIRCDEVGTDGGYEFSIGPSTTQTVMAGEVEAFNFTVDVPFSSALNTSGWSPASARSWQRGCSDARYLLECQRWEGPSPQPVQARSIQAPEAARGRERRHVRTLCLWLDNPTQTFEELAQQCGIRSDSLGRHSRNYLWKERLALSGKLKNSKGKKLAEAKLPAPPEPIERGLIQFALEYLPAIAPDFQLDSLMEMFLAELEAWVEGEHNFLQISPHPRSGKSLAACAAMAYSYLRYPTRHQILISASGRLSAIANQRLRTLIEIALPEGFELAKDNRSKLAFSGNWLGAGLQYAASRGGQLMGLTGNRILCDDLVSSTQEVESPEVMAQAMRTMTTDLFTRLTNDSYGKGSGLCFIAQRKSNTDLVAEMIARERKNEELGLKTTPWRCLVSPFLNPTLEEKVRILESYPDAWTVVWPRFGDVGQPVCNRFTVEFGETLRANMSERDWSSMYELRTDVEDYCPWRKAYLQELEEEDIRISQTFIAVDLNMAGGDRKSDKSALAVGGIQDGNVVILGLHYLQGGLEEQMDQIDTYANSYNAMVVYVEKAAAGHAVLNSMGNFIGDRAYNVRPISHKGKNKGQRLNDVLGPASSGKFFIRKGLELTPVLHEQLKLIAITKGKTKRNDDVGDVVVHLLTAGWYQHVKSGYGQSSVTWGHGAGSAGTTQCVWGRGAVDSWESRRGIDGVQRYSIPGFG